MSLPYLQRIENSLKGREEKNLLRQLAVKSNPDQPHIDLASNDYLGLSKDKRLITTAQNAISLYGTSASASPLVTGYKNIHKELEDKLCQWYNFPSSMLWNTGYAANQAILKNIPEKTDLVLADKLVHNSMLTGILDSKCKFIRYNHCDIEHLASLLSKYNKDFSNIFVATESVFSMDGDYPDLAKLIKLKEQYGFTLIVDEAHAIGWYGKTGSGLLDEYGFLQYADIITGTFGKSLASHGAFSLFRKPILKDYLLNVAGSFIYSTYITPASIAAATEAINIINSPSFDINQGKKISLAFRKELGLSDDYLESPIVSIPIGDCAKTLQISKSLLEDNQILIGAIRPPTVPPGTSRLRASLKTCINPKSTASKISHALHASQAFQNPA